MSKRRIPLPCRKAAHEFLRSNMTCWGLLARAASDCSRSWLWFATSRVCLLAGSTPSVSRLTWPVTTIPPACLALESDARPMAATSFPALLIGAWWLWSRWQQGRQTAARSGARMPVVPTSKREMCPGCAPCLWRSYQAYVYIFFLCFNVCYKYVAVYLSS